MGEVLLCQNSSKYVKDLPAVSLLVWKFVCVCVQTCQHAHINLSISTCYGGVIPVLAVTSGCDFDRQKDELKRFNRLGC